MLDAVVASFVDDVEERELDAPLMALLRANGFFEIHFLHGGYEFGKDFICRRREDDVDYQYTVQSKKGSLNQAGWGGVLPQVELLRTNRLAHPGFDSTLPRKAILVITGRLLGGAKLAAQDYCAQLVEKNDIPLEVWDRERLIELMRPAVSAGLAERTEGALFGVLAAIEDSTITELRIEKFSQRWHRPDQSPVPCVLEAAIVSTQLNKGGRTDLAAVVGLTLVRAGCWHIHGSHPPDAEWLNAANLGRRIFATQAKSLWDHVSHSEPTPTEMIRSHNEAAALITHAVRCVRLAELVALLGLLEPLEGIDLPAPSEVARWLAKFLQRQRASASPISDRWAVAIIPPVLLMAKAGFRDRAADHLRNVLLWVAERYGRGVGLADTSATPAEEIRLAIGNVVPPENTGHRKESYVGTVILDLAAFLDLKLLYQMIRNEMRVLDALPSVMTSEDSRAQYELYGETVSYEPNAPYATSLEREWISAAPHLAPASAPRYLQTIGRSWDHLAVSAVVRDRHFISSWPNLVTVP